MSEIQIEKLEGLARKVSFVLPLSSIEQDTQQRLQQVARNFRKDGFRTGKVPMHIIQKERGEQILFEAQYAKINRLFFDFSKDKGLQIAGTPALEPKVDAPADHFAYDVLFEVYPEFLVGDLSNCELTNHTCEITDAEINKTIEVLSSQYTTYSDASADAQAKDSDKVTIDFQGKIDGELFAGGSATDYSFVLGQKRMLPEFEAGIQGMQAGQSKLVTVNFPEDYQGKEVAGKTAEFNITVSKIENAVAPEINEEFAAKLGIQGGVDKLKEDVQKNLVRETKRRTFSMLKQQVLDVLVEQTPIDAPASLVKEDQERQLESLKQDLVNRGFKNIEQLPYDIEMFKESSEKRVKLGLILAQLVKQHNLQVQPEQVKAQIEEFAQNYEDPKEVMRWYYQDEARLSEMKAYVIENNVVDFVASVAKVTEKAISFEELSQQQPQE
ncbi:MAG: hypothetical protein RLZZ210_341 [Pseudomonadota bacterium]|jgi:trigger factor